MRFLLNQTLILLSICSIWWCTLTFFVGVFVSLSLYEWDGEWWFVFLLWSTLCMFIIDRYFPPKKWHWTQHCLFIWWCCCFYLPQKSKFVMICILSTSRWITREWRLLCGPHFCCSCFLCKDTLCHRTSCCVYRSPSLFQSEQMVYCAICNLNFFCDSFLQNVFGDKKCDRLVFVCFFTKQ